MSLDVWLEAKTPPTAPRSGSGIFVRRNGANVEICIDEWNRAFPDQEPIIATATDDDCEVYWGNVTHNLTTMAEAAGLYRHLWRPDEIGICDAGQLIEPLTAGLAKLQADPDHFKTMNPSNGWGTYDGLCRFVSEYLNACREHPDAAVRVSR